MQRTLSPAQPKPATGQLAQRAQKITPFLDGPRPPITPRLAAICVGTSWPCSRRDAAAAYRWYLEVRWGQADKRAKCSPGGITRKAGCPNADPPEVIAVP